MAKKSTKAVLASAIFGMAVLASCGGGGGSSTGGTGGGNNGGSTQPTPETVAKALVQISTGGYQSSSRQVLLCNLNSDNSYQCDNVLSTESAFYHLYEFPNGNVLLKDDNDKVHYFDGSNIKPLTGKDASGNALDQLDLTGYSEVAKNPYFVVYQDSSNNSVVATQSNYVKISGNISWAYMGKNSNFVIVSISGHTYRVDASGNVIEVKDGGNSVEFKTGLTKVGDNILVQDTNDNIYLLKDSGPSLMLIDTIAGTPEAQMVKVGSDFYIAISDGTNLHYYKNSSQSTTSPQLNTGTLTDFALDKNGNVYYYDNNGSINAITSGFVAISGQSVSSFGGFVGTSKGAVAKGNNATYLVSISGNAISLSTSTDSDLFKAVDTCIAAKSQSPVDQISGESTDQLMCVDGATTKFSWITYDGSNYAGKQLAPISGFGSYYDVDFYDNKAIIYDNSSTQQTEVCTVGSSSCVAGLKAPNGKKIEDVAIKRNGTDLSIYKTSSSNTYTISLGSLITGTTDAFTNLLTKPTGGNVSHDIKTAAAIFKTTDSSCPTGYGNVLRLHKNNGNVYTYTLTSNTQCFDARILKVFY
jgi:hypothetical protein